MNVLDWQADAREIFLTVQEGSNAVCQQNLAILPML